jgi:hypothetical protein
MALVAVVTAGTGVSQSIGWSGRPAKPPIETDLSMISLRPLVTPPDSAGA